MTEVSSNNKELIKQPPIIISKDKLQPSSSEENRVVSIVPETCIIQNRSVIINDASTSTSDSDM